MVNITVTTSALGALTRLARGSGAIHRRHLSDYQPAKGRMGLHPRPNILSMLRTA